MRISDWSSDVFSSDLNVYIGDRRLPSLSAFGVPLVTDFIPLSPAQAATEGFQPSVTDAQGNPLAFDVNGNLVPINFGQQTGNLLNFNGGNGFVLPGNLLTPVRRYLATALADFQLTSNLRLFAEGWRSEEHTSELQSLMRISYAVFCLKKKNKPPTKPLTV